MPLDDMDTLIGGNDAAVSSLDNHYSHNKTNLGLLYAQRAITVFTTEPLTDCLTGQPSGGMQPISNFPHRVHITNQSLKDLHSNSG